jgi:beta-glucosidase
MIAVRDARPGVVMASYNRVNGCHVSENPKMLKEVLRREWGWEGLLISDW